MYCADNRSKNGTSYHEFHLHFFFIKGNKIEIMLASGRHLHFSCSLLWPSPLALSLNRSLIEGQHPTFQHLRW